MREQGLRKPQASPRRAPWNKYDEKSVSQEEEKVMYKAYSKVYMIVSQLQFSITVFLVG